MNKVILIGNMVNNPELRYTSNNKAIANFRIAVKRNYKNEDGTYSSDFITCKVFGKTAEIIHKYCTKGNRIGIIGRIYTNSYEKDGQRKYITDVIVEEFEFLTKKPNDNTPETSKEQQTTFNYVDDAGEELPFE